MQKINILSAGIIALLSVVSNVSAQTKTQEQTNDIRQDSIITVDAFLKQENAKAQEQSRKDNQNLGASSTMPTAALKKNMPSIPATLFVESISGTEGHLVADINYSGRQYKDIHTGSQIGPCQVKSIQGQRVTLTGSTKTVPADQCISANWTGESNPANFRLENMNRMQPSAMPLPPGNLSPIDPQRTNARNPAQ